MGLFITFNQGTRIQHTFPKSTGCWQLTVMLPGEQILIYFVYSQLHFGWAHTSAER